ncbi:MAG TPA: DOPA 4,5-dioxygenase family protein [Chloroflexota bacterium]|nr:DOPA 4,5-dioxygenase family protein [Chloroflexota bacterium]
MPDTQKPDGANPTYEFIDEKIPEEFHFHLYFDTGSGADTRDSALAIRKRLVEEADFVYQLPPVREKPMGPHQWPIWSIWVDRAEFGKATLWMARNHGPHSVLVHPNIDDGYADHTDRAMWLGEPRPLKLRVFQDH